MPSFRGSPDLTPWPTSDYTVRFTSILVDYAHPEDVEYSWSVCDGLVASSPNERETDVTIESEIDWCDGGRRVRAY